MVSFQHEGIAQLVRGRPEFVVELLTQLTDVRIPSFTNARGLDPTFTQVTPAEFHADAFVLLGDAEPVYGIILEAQLQQDDRKMFTWPACAAAARERHKCKCSVVVVAPSPSVARWASQKIPLGCGTFQATVIGPDQIPKITDPVEALRSPELTVLSVIAHGGGDDPVAKQVMLAGVAVLEAVRGSSSFELYLGLIETSLSPALKEVFDMLTNREAV